MYLSTNKTINKRIKYLLSLRDASIEALRHSLIRSSLQNVSFCLKITTFSKATEMNSCSSSPSSENSAA
jgi:hypothetical protein